MIIKICQKFASVHASLSDLRTAAICVTANAGFLRFNELAFLRCCDVRFCDRIENMLSCSSLRVRPIFIETVMLLC